MELLSIGYNYNMTLMIVVWRNGKIRSACKQTNVVSMYQWPDSRQHFHID